MEGVQVEQVGESGQVVRELRDVISRSALVQFSARALTASAQIQRERAPALGKPFQDRLPPSPGGEIAVDQHEDLRPGASLLVVDPQSGCVEKRHCQQQYNAMRQGAQSNCCIAQNAEEFSLGRGSSAWGSPFAYGNSIEHLEGELRPDEVERKHH